MNWSEALRQMPLIAILRGISPAEAVPVATALYDAGFRIMEVPLNGPNPLECIDRMASAMKSSAMIGAGTVLSTDDVENAASAGAQMVVSPNVDPSVIARTRDRGLISLPGFATPTEAFLALHAGASALKLFPAQQMGTQGLRAVREVLPSSTQIFPVGGIDAGLFPEFLRAGAAGFGIGGTLYKPGKSLDAIHRTAAELVDRFKALASAADTSKPA